KPHHRIGRKTIHHNTKVEFHFLDDALEIGNEMATCLLTSTSQQPSCLLVHNKSIVAPIKTS
ncbi:unnamed protein product, partial [Schistosoma rodhaini]